MAPGRFNALPTKRNREQDLSGNPLSQPSKQIYDKRVGNCVYCSESCSNVYAWQGTVAYACGWGHAGFWMDGEIAALEATDLLTGGS